MIYVVGCIGFVFWVDWCVGGCGSDVVFGVVCFLVDCVVGVVGVVYCVVDDCVGVCFDYWGGGVVFVWVCFGVLVDRCGVGDCGCGVDCD